MILTRLYHRAGGGTLECRPISGRDSSLKQHYLAGKSIEEKVITMLYLSSEAGHAVVEYALLLALMILLVIAVMALIGPAIGNAFLRLEHL